MECDILYRIGDSVMRVKKNDPNGSRTRVAAVKGRCPRPLDDGVIINSLFGDVVYGFFKNCQENSSQTVILKKSPFEGNLFHYISSPEKQNFLIKNSLKNVFYVLAESLKWTGGLLYGNHRILGGFL